MEKGIFSLVICHEILIYMKSIDWHFMFLEVWPFSVGFLVHQSKRAVPAVQRLYSSRALAVSKKCRLQETKTKKSIATCLNEVWMNSPI